MSYGSSHSLCNLRLIKGVYDHSLTEESPTVDAPIGGLKVSLRAHQQAVLAAMERHEREVLCGLDCSGEILYSNYGVLGDSVGVGKSLMVLGHIARLKTLSPLRSYTTLSNNSGPSMFSVKVQEFKDLSEAGCLIVVPHTLFRQWADYIKKQTNLKAVYLDKKKIFEADTLQASMLSADVVLVSNTLLKDVSRWIDDRSITWKRVFYDEADTIHITSTTHTIPARFTWFITASWTNLLFPNETIYISQQLLQNYVFQEGSEFACLQHLYKEQYSSHRPYHYVRNFMTSFNYFRGMLNATHRLRGRMVLRCSDSFIQKSISLPQLTRTNILCKAPITQQIVGDVVPTEIQSLLHGGDVAGAIQALGVKAEDTTSLVDAVTKNLQKELERLRATHTFKASLEYSTPKAKEEALKHLEDKIAQKEVAIQALKERIEGFKNEMCPICYDEPQSALLTPCCSRVFCGQCILECLTRATTCPMCRSEIKARDLKKVVAAGEANTIVPAGTAGGAGAKPEDELLKKSDALFKIFEQNSQGRFLVFSRYDNPFTTMESSIDALGIRVKQLKGNKDAIAATLRAFHEKDLRCLLLNSHYAGAGLNITAATHVILLHAMTHEEEKQILGRAYRMGRTEPLTFIRLLHPDEMPNSS